MDITLFTNISSKQQTQYYFNSNTNTKHHDQPIMIINANNDQDQTAILLDTTMQSSNHNLPPLPPLPLPLPTASTSLSPDSALAAAATEQAAAGKWAPRLLKECAKAISDKDSTKIHHLLWILNELASPYGDCDQKLASYFLQALFCKATDSGLRCYRTLTSVADKTRSFDCARRLILKFQEVSPWTTFGHVASNGAILEALDGETKLHIIDISNTLCTQWPTLLEALATRNDETPRLKLTVVVTAATVVGGGGGGSVMKEITQRMEKFARLMGVPFEFKVVSELRRLGELTREGLGVQDDEAVAVNCVGALRRAEVEDREAAMRAFRSLNPRIVTVVEEEADFTATRENFVGCFEECLRFYTLYFEMLEESFPATSNEKLMLERECSRGIVRVLACDDHDQDQDQDHDHQEMDQDPEGDRNNSSSNNNKISNCCRTTWDCSERREKGKQWSERLKRASFWPVGYSDDVLDDVKALLKRYPSGWGLIHQQQQQQQSQAIVGEDHRQQEQQEGQLLLHDDDDDSSSTSASAGIYLTWKEEPVVWASAWKP
ncbi:GRAS transcription factor [Parasponia andersonii]|uniref:GRAS transcription factor n=1 Tax=Parasponia andersonii TaxID=3476 RepID=A0A2P5CRB0_PARAD|nr:GRAS transcription factor [Parasponia andersonii]